jgi:transcription termination/antitermination protein NusG
MNEHVEAASSVTRQNQSAKRWYAVRTMSRHEKQVASEFDRKGMTAFLPLTTERRLWSDREKEVSIPLFPGYVFVQIAPSSNQRLEVLRSSGVVSFVPQSGAPVEVPADQIDGVRAMLSLKEECETRPYMESGQRVRVKGGSLNGVEGILITQNKNSMLVVSIDAIGKSVAIRFHGYECEPV